MTDAEKVDDGGGDQYAVYDNAELRFLDGTFPTAAAARKAHADVIKRFEDRDPAHPSNRYEARKV